MPMNTVPPVGYTAYYVAVSLKGDTLVFEPAELTISASTTATITWVADGDDFTFKDFSWCNAHAFLSRTIILDPCIVSVVYNHSQASKGGWAYQVTAVSKKSKRVEYSSPQCAVTVQADGRPIIRTQ